MTEAVRYLGNSVRSLQTMLRRISSQDSRILPLIPDGYYGPNTYASVLSFQQAYALPETGAVDLLTWEKVVAVYTALLPTLISPTIAPLWIPGFRVAPGNSNLHLYLVQAMLRVLSLFFAELEAPQVTGFLDPVTAAGLRWIQKAAGLEETGGLDSQTWHELSGLYRAMSGDGMQP